MYPIAKTAYNVVMESLSRYKANGMESNTEVHSRLKLIGRLQKGEKIDTKRIFVQPDCMFTSVTRTLFNQDNRANCLTFVQNTIHRSFEILQTYERSDSDTDKAMCVNIVRDLVQAKIGLSHLTCTYATDLKFKCDIDTLIQMIDARLTNIRVPEDDQRSDTRSEPPYETYSEAFPDGLLQQQQQSTEH